MRWRVSSPTPRAKTSTWAVVRANEERLARTPRRRAAGEETAIEALFDRLPQLPVLDRRSPDEIIGYGPDGLPR